MFPIPWLILCPHLSLLTAFFPVLVHEPHRYYGYDREASLEDLVASGGLFVTDLLISGCCRRVMRASGDVLGVTLVQTAMSKPQGTVGGLFKLLWTTQKLKENMNLTRCFSGSGGKRDFNVKRLSMCLICLHWRKSNVKQVVCAALLKRHNACKTHFTVFVWPFKWLNVEDL